LALVAWIIRSLDWQQVWQVWGAAHPGWAILALVTVLLTIAARVGRWRGLLLPQRFGATKLLTALLTGQVVNYVVLARLGDVARAAALGQGHRARALGTVALEKLWDVGMLLGLTAALSLGLTLPDWLVLPARLLAAGSLASLLLLLVVLFSRDRLPSAVLRWRFEIGGWRLEVGDWLSAILDGMEGLIRPRARFWGLGGSLCRRASHQRFCFWRRCRPV
jgi:uncharacterized membrane protein YbhN (UPF0104 family)